MAKEMGYCDEMETPENYEYKSRKMKQPKMEVFNFSEYKYQGEEKFSPRNKKYPSGKTGDL